MKFLGYFILSFILLQAISEAVSTGNAAVSLSNVHAEYEAGFQRKYHMRKINCNYACARRCSRSSRANLCNRACKSCCFRCQCVPPGTSGNTHTCPCYANLKTHGNRAKCP